MKKGTGENFSECRGNLALGIQELEPSNQGSYSRGTEESLTEEQGALGTCCCSIRYWNFHEMQTGIFQKWLNEKRPV